MTTIEEPLVEPTSVALPTSLLRPIVRMLLWPALGAVLGLVLLVKVVLPTFGVGSVERVVQLGRHLDQPLTPAPSVAFLGNSITREGVDTRLVDETAPAGWHAQNFAISAASLSEMRVQLPKILSARPAAVAFGLRPEDMGRVDDIDLDKAFAYAMGGFVAAWPEGWTHADLPGIGSATYDALRSSPLAQDLHFRTAPLNIINQEVRVRLRSGLRKVAPDNWTDPYELAFSVRDERLQRHIESIQHDMEMRLSEGGDAGAQLTKTLAAEIHAAGSTPVLIVLPMHPAFRASMQPHITALRSLLGRIAQEESGIMIDALDVLAADEYADALHPNAAGREIYSRFLGRALAPLSGTSIR
ncbi:MAG TPA: SGNH/GDSL hydrolase family protein [Pirellulales bacterium]|nr:SGNH/GDSL hydrolase family protein [Pirellulales bacterium]